MSEVWSPASAMAAWAAGTAMSDDGRASVTKWRVLMPVRTWIHSSEVSMMREMSELVTTLGGTYMPVPLITARMPALLSRKL